MDKLNGTERKDLVRLLKALREGNTFSITPQSIIEFSNIDKKIDEIANGMLQELLEIANEIARQVTAQDIERFVEWLKNEGVDEATAKSVAVLYKLQIDRAVYMRLIHELIAKLSSIATVGDELAVVKMSLALQGVDGEKIEKILQQIEGHDRDVF